MKASGAPEFGEKERARGEFYAIPANYAPEIALAVLTQATIAVRDAEFAARLCSNCTQTGQIDAGRAPASEGEGTTVVAASIHDAIANILAILQPLNPR